MGNNFYCAAPWRGLHINFRGDVKTCCAGNPNLLGNLNEKSIQEIIQGTELQEIRRLIRDGKPHEFYCSNCIQAETFGKSERHWHNDVNQEFDVRSAELDYFDPTIIDIRWNNTCNLSCNYCGDYCSSKWQSIKKSIPVKNGARPYYQQVCDFLSNHASDIREVAMVGGEPLLLPENETLLDVIPRDCIVTLITNMSVDFERNPIFKKLAQRNRVGWSMSFDNIDERFEYVRHGGKWELLKHNIGVVKTLMKEQGHWGGAHSVYNIYNCTRIMEFREWLAEQETTVVWQNLFQPEFLDPLQHDIRVRALALQEIEKILETNYIADSERDFFQHAHRNLAQDPTNNNVHVQGFREHIQENETKYHRDKAGQFRKLWPELSFLID